MSGGAGLAEVWDELVSAALIGTDRRPPPPVPAGRLERFGTGDDPASALLDRAAAVQAARRAGAMPAAAGEPLRPAPADPRLPCPNAAAGRLGSVLRGQHPELLGELVEAMVSRGCSLPPEHLLTLMDRSRPDPELRRLVVTAAGSILPWLGSVLPRLGWPTATPAEDPAAAWEHGSQAERVEILLRLRATDPGTARALLSSGLAKERAEHRTACLATLAEALSPDDEPLLEQALDDRSPHVREVAAGLLARLRSSAWASRMASRARELVRLEVAGGRDRLDVRLVAPVPADWERDGVTAAAPAGTSVGAHVLHQVVAGTPLDAWAELGRPVDIVVLAGEHELRDVLLSAWAEAAVRQADRAWARLLLDETHDPALVVALAPDDVTAVALRRANPDDLLTPLTVAALDALPRPWPDEVRRRAAGAVVALFVDRRVGRHRAPLLHRLVRVLDPAALRPLAGALGRVDLAPPLDGVRDDVVHLARFRAEMLEELAPEVRS